MKGAQKILMPAAWIGDPEFDAAAAARVPQPAIDSLTAAAAVLCGQPAGLVAVPDRGRWSVVGASGDTGAGAYACLLPWLVRTADSPAVVFLGAGPFRAGFFAGVRLGAEPACGVLCVFGPEPGALTQQQETALIALGRTAALLLRERDETAALRRSEEVFRRSFDYAAYGKVLVSLEQGVLSANAAVCQMLGYSEAELKRVDLQSLAYGPDMDAELPYIRRIMAGEIDSYQVEKRHLHKTGRVVWTQMNVTMARDSEGRPLNAIVQLLDITEQKRAIEALRLSEARYRTLADNVSDLIVLQDEQLTCLYASPSCTRMLGITPEELAASTDSEMVHPHDIERFARIVKSLSAVQPRLHSMHRLRRKDGSYIWADVSLHWIPGEEGQPVRILSVVRDVTERKKAEEEAAAASALMQQALDSMLDGVALYDADSRLVFTNRTLRWRSDRQYNHYTIGYTYEKVLRTYLGNAPEPLSPERIEELVAAAVERYRRGDGVAAEYPTHTGDWLLVRNIRMPGGRTLSVTTDITAIKRATAALEAAKEAAQRLEALLRDAIEVIDDAVAVYDRDERLIVANSAMRRLNGAMEPLFQAGTTFPEIFEKLAASLEPGSPEAASVRRYADARIARFRQADGSAFEELTNLNRWILSRDFRTGEGGTVSVATDFTQLKLSAIELGEARNRAEAANRAKSAFLASMSHEIRTPLSGIIGFADLLLLDQLSPTQRERVKLLREAGESLLAIISDILDFSKIEAGKLEIERIAMSPASVTDSAVSIIRAQIVAKGLRLEVQHAPDLPDWVESDPSRVRQILLNLLSNALKFTPDGTIVVRTEVDRSAERAFLRFEVEDSGIGVPRDRRHLLFRDFTQMDPSTTRRYGGTGLGLAISRRLAEALGGTIGIDDPTGRGSVFWFTIPLTLAAPPRAMALDGAAAKPSSRALRVLVAEDLRMNQIVARGLLKAAGHEVVLVEDGRQAVAAVAADRYDIVLMDMQMPEMDGLTATRAIRALPGPARDVPIIALTANAMSDDVQRCRDAGMNDFLLKPIGREALAAVLARWVGHRDG